MEEKRLCRKCNKKKFLDEFATYKRGGKTRHLRSCKECHRESERERQRTYIAENREAHNRRSRENKRRRYREDSSYREELRGRSQEYYREHREEILSRQKERYHEPFEMRPLSPRDSFLTPEEELQDALAEARRNPRKSSEDQ